MESSLFTGTNYSEPSEKDNINKWCRFRFRHDFTIALYLTELVRYPIRAAKQEIVLDL